MLIHSAWWTQELQGMPIRLDPERNEFAALANLVPTFRGCQVLEVGCGDGRLTRQYAKDAASVLAIDPDESAIAALRDDPPEGVVTLRAIGFERLAVPDQTFDIVLFSWSL